ncbi:hypothetical protein AVEN_229948-1 [Araneus ventricosus]|uniref:Uncharacterized protein n=1 Tax=Araneus ventricosus TaxID=182803 RepID=A0A4Y2BYU8_ARAVE|nr:hypothetical protein AVEN_229948-1 [Araneus ventricosus]
MLLFPAISTDSGLIIQIPAHAGKRETPLHFATSCHLTSSFHFTKPSVENTLLWWKNLLLNKLSRIKIAKLISFLTDHEDLIKQEPDATNSPDPDPNFSPSPRHQTDEPGPSRGPRPRTLISPPTSF